MRVLITYLLLLTSSLGFGQVVCEKKSFDFGDLYSGAQTYQDFVFTNKSQKTQFLLTIDKPRDVYYIFSAKTIPPDSSIVIRFKVNDQRKGRFNYDVDVYFSEPRDPMIIKLSGNIKESATNSLTDCPDFNTTPSAMTPTTFDIVIKVIDSLTRKPIQRSKVYMVERGDLVGEHFTNSKGFVKKSYPLGYYYIVAEKDGYASNFFEGYINFKRNYVEIELSQPVQEEIAVVEEEEEEEIEIVIDNNEEEEEEVVHEVELAEEPVKDTIPEVVYSDDEFDPRKYKYNNITFILDVSTSMNSSGKLNLLKMSMIELVKMLRAEDKVTLIKYSSNVEAIMTNESGAHHDEIIEAVKGLKTSGLTAGGDAIKYAYKLNRSGYIDGGNNIVIMITDGAFNKGDKDYLKTIENNYKSKGIRFSVVGIQTSQYLTTHMENVVNKGGGAYVKIKTLQDAQSNLIDEIRRTSYKSTPK